MSPSAASLQGKALTFDLLVCDSCPPSNGELDHDWARSLPASLVAVYGRNETGSSYDKAVTSLCRERAVEGNDCKLKMELVNYYLIRRFELLDRCQEFAGQRRWGIRNRWHCIPCVDEDEEPCRRGEPELASDAPPHLEPSEPHPQLSERSRSAAVGPSDAAPRLGPLVLVSQSLLCRRRVRPSSPSRRPARFAHLNRNVTDVLAPDHKEGSFQGHRAELGPKHDVICVQRRGDVRFVVRLGGELRGGSGRSVRGQESYSGWFDSGFAVTWRIVDEVVSNAPTVAVRVGAIVPRTYDTGCINSLGDGAIGLRHHPLSASLAAQPVSPRRSTTQTALAPCRPTAMTR